MRRPKLPKKKPHFFSLLVNEQVLNFEELHASEEGLDSGVHLVIKGFYTSIGDLSRSLSLWSLFYISTFPLFVTLLKSLSLLGSIYNAFCAVA